MTVKELIGQLSKLPQDENIYFCSYDTTYAAEVKWDITQEEYEEGCSDEPYIYLTETTRHF